MELNAEDMFAQMMAAMANADQPKAETAAHSCKVEFFEQSNTVDESVAGIASRMVFTGCFAIDDYMIQRKDGSPVQAGLGADFNESGGPTAAWIWFSTPVNDAVKQKFEEFFGGSFDEDGLRMPVDAEAFLDFSDSKGWGVYEEEGDPLW